MDTANITKGKVTLIGDCEYSIDVVYSHEHGPESCTMCAVLMSRSTGRNYAGIKELAESLAIILENYAYEIRMSELYSHARTITVTVFRGRVGQFDRTAIEAHEITKG